MDIAYDYTKKKNVFRLKTFNGSEYLFQAEDQETMITWIEAIQANNNPDADVSHSFLYTVQVFILAQPNFNRNTWKLRISTY